MDKGKDLLRTELLEEGGKEVNSLESLDVSSGSEFIVPDYISALFRLQVPLLRKGADSTY